MRTILVACVSQETAERGLRVAADLSIACGARLSLAYSPEQSVVIGAAAGLDAVGDLSNVLFAPGDWRCPAPAFGPRETKSWLAAMEERVEDRWEIGDRGSLPAEVHARRPDLVITCDGELARILVAHTTGPVWRVRPKQRQQSWFPVGKLRCAVLGSRALEWAGQFAAGLGAELETAPPGLFGDNSADLVVVDREARARLLSRAMQPIVVV